MKTSRRLKVQSLKGLVAEVGKLLVCKIAMAAVLLFQHFIASCSRPSTSLHLFFPHIYFDCPHHSSAECVPLSGEDVTL